MMRDTTGTVERYLTAMRELGLVWREEVAREHLDMLFEGVEVDGKRLLDIGGGSGIYSFYAAARGAREVVCLEPEAAGSSEGVTRVFDKIRAKLSDTTVRLDARTIQEYAASEPFDIVFMHASINHIDEESCIHLLDDRAAWENYKRHFTHIGGLLGTGGTIIISDCAPHNFFALLGIKNPLCPTIEWHKHQTPESWARLLREVGFRRERIGWEPLFRFGKAGRLLLSNKPAAYFLKSTFRLVMVKG